MGTAIIIVVLVIIVIFAVKSGIKHGKGEGGCCGSGGTMKEDKKVLAGDIIATKLVTIEGMHCDNCKNSIEHQINRIDGAACEVNLKKKTAAADTYSSRPGNSEHQTGLCFDLNSIEDSFQYTSEGKWVNDNCYKYGFCIRFPKGKDAYTGYQYESWHLRYVGTELAEKLYNNGDWISLEEYFGITSEYPD